ncbi:hypothetical protein AC1031_011935 [Aphanomyces cochlioides]|nr:hypothetical protein AC1031_011935 [Aphanomyces cochlioides]
MDLLTPKKQKPTGNDVLEPLPVYYDLMEEYWGSKLGYRRESLLSTDETITCDSSTEEVIDSYDQSLDTQGRKIELQDKKPEKQEKISFSRQKAPSNSAAIESGLFAIKDGLIALGNSIQNQNHAAPPMQAPSGASLDDVLAAIQSQSNSMMVLVQSIQQPPPPSSNASLDDVLTAIQSQTTTMEQLIAHLTANKG